MEKPIQVTKEEFYKAIGSLDVIVNVQGVYPYTKVFSFRYGGEFGRIVGSFAEGARHPVIDTYFLQSLPNK